MQRVTCAERKILGGSRAFYLSYKAIDRIHESFHDWIHDENPLLKSESIGDVGDTGHPIYELCAGKYFGADYDLDENGTGSVST